MFFNIRTVLKEPYSLELSNAFFTATCTWLVHIASSSDHHHRSEGEEQMNIIKKLPLTSPPNQQLSYIPELIIENITSYLNFLNGFNPEFFEVTFSNLTNTNNISFFKVDRTISE
jgi:hypothetical protein